MNKVWANFRVGHDGPEGVYMCVCLVLCGTEVLAGKSDMRVTTL